MTGPLDIGLTLVKTVGPPTRNLFSIMCDAALAKERVLVAQQRRSLAERFNVAPTVIDALMERELETRESTSHGMRLEVKEPSTGLWTGERIGGDVYVSVRNEWVHPATLTKMAATLEVPGWDAHVDVTSEDKDRLIPGMTAHSIKLRWS
jgi:hypothetical protein